MPKRRKQKVKNPKTSKTLSFAFLSEKTKRFLYSGLMFLLAVIFLLSFFNKAGIIGRGLKGVFEYLIGNVIYITPLFLILIGLIFFKSPNSFKEIKNSGIFAIFLLIFAGAGILELQELNSQDLIFKKFVWNYSGLGGWLGYVFSWPLLKGFGFWGALSIFLIIIGVSLLIILEPFWQKFPKKLSFKEKLLSDKEIEKVPIVSQKKFFPFFKIKKISFAKKEEKTKEIIQPFNPSSFGFEKENFEVKRIEEEKEPSLYIKPPLDLLEEEKTRPQAGDIGLNSAIIKRTLLNFGIPVEMSEVNVGPTVTQYTLKPAEGVKLSKITTLSSDLALALASHPIRIEAPIPGRSLMGIEVPNKKRVKVGLRELIGNEEFQKSSSSLLFSLGKDVKGTPIFADLAQMPHLLVAGSTGSGKTICLNCIILSLLFRNSFENVRLILIDPKRVEFPVYNALSHLLCPVICNAQKTAVVLKWLVGEMERRFKLLAEAKSRNIENYNTKNRKEGELKLPYIILIIDELADLMASRGKEIEALIVRLAQMSRAVGIHLILATQRPSVEVITGLIKANITSRIAFQVASQIDSRTILDMAGAEKLLGRGDLLFVSTEIIKPKRAQGAFVSEKEVKKVINWVAFHHKELAGESQVTEALFKELQEAKDSPDTQIESFYTKEDLLYEEAKKIVIASKKASASLLQRRLGIGYARAARLLDILEERGVVGPADGAKPREVYIQEENEI